MKSTPLEKIFPILKVENNCIINHQADITVAFKITLPEIFTMSASDYESIHNTFVKAIRILPPHSLLHKQDWFVATDYTPDFDKEQSFFSRASERHFNERPYLDHSSYIYLTKKGETKRAASPMNSSLLKKNLVPKQAMNEKDIEQFLDKTGQFQKILEDSGFIKMERLTTEQLASGDNPGLIEKYCYLQLDGQPIIRDIELKPTLKVGNLNCQIFTLADMEDMPSLCGQSINYEKYSTEQTRFSVGFTAPICQLLSCNHIYNQYIIISDAQETIKKMEAKALRLHSLSTYSRENTITRDATNKFLNEAIAQQRLPIKAHFNILTWSERKEDGKEIRNQVSAALAQLDARTKEESVNAAHLYWCAIPGNAGELPANEMFDTFAEQAACFFNTETNYQSSISPIGIRFGDRLSGNPLHVDISDEPMRKGICTNRNKFILGPSGSGKSFFTNHMMRSYYECGAHIVIVDVGHSYKGLCELVNGYYYTYSETNPIKFNPFFIDGGVLDTEKKESIKTLLLALWKKEDQSYTRAEYIALSNALQSYYDKLDKHPDIFPCFDTFYDFLKNEFNHQLGQDGIKEKDFDITNLLYVLRPYAKGGEYDYLLNARENLQMLDQPFIVFEIDALKDHPILFTVTTITIMEIFISKMRKLKGIRKVILIEEAWKAIARAGMAEYIKYLFKTVRKHFGEAIVVSQEVADIISSDIIKDAIINNSDCKILLDQSKYVNKFHQVQSLLGLTDKEKALILSMNKANDPKLKYKEVFISLGGILSKVYRTEVSLEEYLCYSTEEKEKVQVQAYAARYGSMQKGIAMLAQQLRSAA
ncbi:Bacteroides conjugation system ATPase, TraG family [Filimonas lacunae]|uniref:Bacteroides conjugation system ATPase, TraG family n=1 Tax=Filimonas lacunae TaxID=477680 RepID=A0A173MAG2_9BACT|nr:TraG family conjugative transposon ATPase [Filimonas lacunae]BAV04448.1 conjugative transposon protein TraG [Filimonas lacunae]SIT31467.1 Bacteroides conjugation system ATPase, TraG family [Filimonas lacunae]